MECRDIHGTRNFQDPFAAPAATRPYGVLHKMSNLIPLEDAAKMLGLSVDKLSEMRSNSEIFGYKDGTSWKFKMQELERVADEFELTLNPGAIGGVEADSDDEAAQVLDLDDDDFDLSLASDDEDSELSLDISDSADLFLEDDESSVELSLPTQKDELQAADGDELELEDDDPALVLLDVHDTGGVDEVTARHEYHRHVLAERDAGELVVVYYLVVEVLFSHTPLALVDEERHRVVACRVPVDVYVVLAKDGGDPPRQPHAEARNRKPVGHAAHRLLRRPLSRFQAKWTPVCRPEARQNRGLNPRNRSIRDRVAPEITSGKGESAG